MIPLVGFLPAHDPRVRGTIEAIRRELSWDGFVLRYRSEEGVVLVSADMLAALG